MTKLQVSFELCENESKGNDHSSELLRVIRSADKFECIVAFANSNVLKEIRPALMDLLKKGKSARFTIGLSYYHTEPVLLSELLKLAQAHPAQISLLIEEEPRGITFHPKVYAALTKTNGSNALIGSANLTQGGLNHNHELSSHLVSNTPALFRKFTDYVDSLIQEGWVVDASEELIARYEVDYIWQRRYRVLAEKKANVAATIEDPESEDAIKGDFFADTLKTMRRERDGMSPSMGHFDAEVDRRDAHRPMAKIRLENIAAQAVITPSSMLADYDDLVCNPLHLWHSGNLHRTRNGLAVYCKGFRDGLRVLDQLNLDGETAQSAYAKLQTALKNVKYAGINVMTEILHTYDHTKFPVMNQNSVAGILFAFPGSFPEKPSRSITPEMYADFVEKCDGIRARLGLANFAELDVLFNYIYFS